MLPDDHRAELGQGSSAWIRNGPTGWGYETLEVSSMLLYGSCIFLGACLLFLVQPLIARIILPWFGGTASVWSTCLMFFQVVLLGGYFYSHVLIQKLNPKVQARLHFALLALSLLALPIMPGAGWKPADPLHPSWRIVALLGATVGIPYLLLSATGPLLQAWYARGKPGGSPYRLYALSNAGSLAALLGYPAVLEPGLSIRHQAFLWSAVYACFVPLCGWAALEAAKFAGERGTAAAARAPGWKQLALWAGLAFCPSALLVGVTSHITQNISPMPLLWIAPLALYLLSFILTFDSDRWYARWFWFPAFIATAALMIGFLFPENRNLQLRLIMPLFLGGFFTVAVTCHGELYRLRPAATSLTWFYLMLATGGAMGGLFVGLIAPALFNNYYELPIALLAALVLVSITMRHGEAALPGPSARLVQWGLLAATGAGLVYLIAWDMPVWARQYRVMIRSFYGVLRVQDTPETATTAGLRELHNGIINHGSEFTDPGRHREPTTYYGPNSGVGVALQGAARPGPRRVGVIGLGAGTLAAYCQPGDWYRFYEINPTVVAIAREQFFFLRECPAEQSIALGDARLSLEREDQENFDVLAVDAFSGDSIPVHLLTIEAFQQYFRHLRGDGVLAVHISNRYLDLGKVVAGAAEKLQLHAVLITDEDNPTKGTSRTDWAILTRAAGLLDRREWQVMGRNRLEKSSIRPWTDDYSSVLSALK